MNRINARIIIIIRRRRKVGLLELIAQLASNEIIFGFTISS